MNIYELVPQKAQTLSATAGYKFNEDGSKKNLEVTKLRLGLGSKIDDIGWDDTLDKMVSKTASKTLLVTGVKTFKQNEFSVPKDKVYETKSGFLERKRVDPNQLIEFALSAKNKKLKVEFYTLGVGVWFLKKAIFLQKYGL